MTTELSTFSDLDALCARACDRIDVAMHHEPWLRLPRRERIDHLPDLLQHMLALALETGNRSRELRDAVLKDARVHGEHRAAQGFDEEVVMDEYYILREQVFRVLRDHGGVPEWEDAIFRLDRVISVAMLASMRGLYGRGVEGLWEQSRAN